MDSKKTFWISYSVLLFLFSLRVIPLIFPEGRFWGFNHLIFLPKPFTVLYLCLAGIALILPFWRIATRGSETLINGFSRVFYEASTKNIARLIVIIALGILFAIFSAKTHFLGDGYLQISNMASENPIVHKWSERGTTLILSFILSLTGSRSEQVVLLLFQGVSIASGIISVFFFFYISETIGRDKIKKLLIFMILLMSGGLLLFFGYVESYPFLWIFFAGFIYFCFRYFEEKKVLIFAALFLVAGIFIHLQMLMYIPAFLYLIFHKGQGKIIYDRHKNVFCGLILLIGLILLTIFLYKFKTDLYFENIFMPVFDGKPKAPYYKLFSLPHLLDIFNLFVLLSPAIFLFAVLSLKYIRNIGSNPVLIFLSLLSFGSLTFLMLVDPQLGMPRDWDLYSLSAIAPGILLVLMLQDHGLLILKRFILSLLIFLIIANLPYLMVNLKAQESQEYAKYFINLDPGKSFTSLIILRDYYGNHDQFQRGDSVNAVFIGYFPDYQKYPKIYNAIRNGDLKSARKLAESITPDRFSPGYHDLMSTIYMTMGDYKKALDATNKSIELERYNYVYYSKRGWIYYRLENYNRSLESFKSAYTHNMRDPGILEGLAATSKKLGDYDAALHYSEKLINIDSANSAGYYLLSKAFFHKGICTEAITNYNQYIRRGRRDPLYNARLAELSELLRGMQDSTD